MEDYLQLLKRLITECLESEDKDSIQFISITFNSEPAPFKGIFIIADSRRILIPSKMPFELTIFISFTYLTPLGKKLEEVMSTSELFKTFDHKLVGKTSTYMMQTGNNTPLIVSTIQEIVENIFPSVDKQDIDIRVLRTQGILGYLTDPG